MQKINISGKIKLNVREKIEKTKLKSYWFTFKVLYSITVKDVDTQ
jgi:hypothetical protein